MPPCQLGSRRCNRPCLLGHGDWGGGRYRLRPGTMYRVADDDSRCTSPPLTAKGFPRPVDLLVGRSRRQSGSHRWCRDFGGVRARHRSGCVRRVLRNIRLRERSSHDQQRPSWRSPTPPRFGRRLRRDRLTEVSAAGYRRHPYGNLAVVLRGGTRSSVSDVCRRGTSACRNGREREASAPPHRGCDIARGDAEGSWLTVSVGRAGGVGLRPRPLSV